MLFLRHLHNSLTVFFERHMRHKWGFDRHRDFCKVLKNKDLRKCDADILSVTCERHRKPLDSSVSPNTPFWPPEVCWIGFFCVEVYFALKKGLKKKP